jgi:hypothetical protein
MPWFRAILTRTPRGRRLRRRAAIVFAVLTAWYWIPLLFAFSPRKVFKELGIFQPPPPKPCQYHDECGPCEPPGVPYCVRGGGCFCTDPKWIADMRELDRRRLAARGLVCGEFNREGLAQCWPIDAGGGEGGDP